MGGRSGGAADHGEARREAEALVAEAMSEAAMLAPDLDVTGTVELGDPAAVLVEHARGHALLVVGSRGLGGFAGLLLGSVAQRVAAHATVPVAVVRFDLPDPPYPPAPSGPVVVGVGTDLDGRVIAAALAEASAHDCGVVAVHAWEPPPVRWYPPQTDDRAAELLTAETRWLADTVGPAQAGYPAVPLDRRLRLGGAAHALVEASRGARLLVVGTRGRGPLAGLLLGSVSHQVLQHALCPVLVVRPQPDPPQVGNRT